jgi:hypothetical protein
MVESYATAASVDEGFATTPGAILTIRTDSKISRLARNRAFRRLRRLIGAALRPRAAGCEQNVR